MRRWCHAKTGEVRDMDFTLGDDWKLIIVPEESTKTSQESINDPLPAERFPVNYCFTTLRDYFAGMAMQVIMATGKRELSFHEVADAAFRQADAMVSRGREGL